MATAEQRLTIAIRAVNEASAQIKSAQADIDALGETADKNNQRMEKLGAGLSSMGKMAGMAAVGVAAAGAAAGVALFKLGSDFDDAYDTIQIGTGATGDVLEGLKGSFKNVFTTVPTDMKSASLAIADINTKLGLSGPALEDTAKTALELSRITGTDLAGNIDKVSKLTSNWNLTAEATGPVMDKLFIASQATGVGIDQLAEGVTKFGPILRDMGLGMDESIAIMGSLSKAGVDGELAFKGLQKAVISAAKDGVPAKEAISGLFDSIKNAKDPTERLNIAVEAFGTKAGPQLADAIASGKFSVAELTAQIENSADAVQSAGRDTADFAEKWQLFKNRVMTSLEPAATAVLAFAGTMADKLFPILEKVVNWVSEKAPPAIAAFKQAWEENVAPMIDRAIELGDTIREKVQPPLERIFTWLKENEKTMGVVGAIIGGVLVVGFVALGAAAMGAAVGLIAANLPLIAITAAVAGLSAGIYLLVTNWDTITQKFPILGEMADKAKEKFNEFTNWFMNEAWPQIQFVFDSLVSGAQKVIAFFQEHWGTIKEVITPVFEQLEDVVERVFTFVVDIIQGAFNTVIGVFKIFKGIFTGDWDLVWEGIKQTVSGVWQFISAAPKLALGIMWDVIQAGLGVIKELWEATWEWTRKKLSDAWDAIKEGVREGINGVVDFVTELPGKIVGFFVDAGKWLYDIGKEIVGGLLGGLKDKIADVWNEVGGWAGKIKDLKGPIEEDRVLLVDEGMAIAEGLATGLQDGFESNVVPVAGSWAQQVAEAFALADLQEKLGSGGMRVFDSLIEAITTGAEKARGILSGDMVKLLGTLEDELGPAVAKEYGDKLMAALTLALETGGAQGIDVVKAVLGDIQGAIDKAKEDVPGTMGDFLTSFTDTINRFKLEDKVGDIGMNVLDALTRAIEEGTPKALGALGVTAAGLVDKLAEALGPAKAKTISAQFMDAITAAIETGGAEGIEALKKILEQINGLIGDVASGGTNNPTFGSAATTQAEYDAALNRWENSLAEAKKRLKDAEAHLAWLLQQWEVNPATRDQQAVTEAKAQVQWWQQEIRRIERNEPVSPMTTQAVLPLATGTDYIPHDGFAFLHKGEAVVPASMNRGGITITVNASGYIRDTDELVRDIDRSLKRNGLRGLTV